MISHLLTVLKLIIMMLEQYCVINLLRISLLSPKKLLKVGL